MSVLCGEVASFIEEIAPSRLAENWDNVGLLVGSWSQEINRIMVCLDVTSKVVDEAVEKKVDLIVSHHPLIFKGMKRICEEDFKGRMIYKLIRNNIGVFSAHTNLDAALIGMNDYLAEILGVGNLVNLTKHQTEKLYKIVVFVPQDSVEVVRNSLCNAGAGYIGNYSHCTFMTEGTGTFKPLEGSNPYIGSQGNLEKVNEYRIETIVPQTKLKNVIDSMIKAHPYEEVAYDIYPLELSGNEYGLGKAGTLDEPMDLNSFIARVKEKLCMDNIKLIGSIDREISRVALFCGSLDSSIISSLFKHNIDVLVTGDVKHHDALDMMEMGLCVIDAGHFATERIMVPKMTGLLSKKFPNLEVMSNSVETDPIKYC